MHMRDFSLHNKRRCTSPQGFNHDLRDWSADQWITALVGELGEACNLIKKRTRIYDGVPGNDPDVTIDDLNRKIAEELADTFIYLDLLAQANGIDLEAAVATKFNKTSKKIEYPQVYFEG